MRESFVWRRSRIPWRIFCHLNKFANCALPCECIRTSCLRIFRVTINLDMSWNRGKKKIWIKTEFERRWRRDYVVACKISKIRPRDNIITGIIFAVRMILTNYVFIAIFNFNRAARTRWDFNRKLKKKKKNMYTL